MRKPPRNNHGFTIIEILVVVAIMAILAGISIPQYQKMVNKGNQQGAVAGLTSVYMAEKNYAAENHTYTACIRKIGVNPQPGTNWYAMGFNSAGLNPSCGEAGNANCKTYVWDEGAPVTPCQTGTGNVAAPFDDDVIAADRHNNLTAPIPDSTMAGQALIGSQPGDMTNTTFKARAVGNVSSKSAYDRWSIDQNGNPVNDVNNI